MKYILDRKYANSATNVNAVSSSMYGSLKFLTLIATYMNNNYG